MNRLFTHNLTGRLTSLAAHNKMSSEFRAKGLLYPCDKNVNQKPKASMTSGREQRLQCSRLSASDSVECCIVLGVCTCTTSWYSMWMKTAGTKEFQPRQESRI